MTQFRHSTLSPFCSSLVRTLRFSLVVLTLTSFGVALKTSAEVPPMEHLLSSHLSTKNAIADGSEISSPGLTESPQTNNQYRSDRFGFSFSYPTGYELTVGHPNDGTVEEYIVFLRQEDINDPEPPFVSVHVYNNPNQLSLEDFQTVQGYFIIQEFAPTTVAGQDALEFESAGLYIDRQYLFKTPDGAHIVSLYASSDIEPLWQMAEGIRHSFQW